MLLHILSSLYDHKILIVIHDSNVEMSNKLNFTFPQKHLERQFLNI